MGKKYKFLEITKQLGLYCKESAVTALTDSWAPEQCYFQFHKAEIAYVWVNLREEEAR